MLRFVNVSNSANTECTQMGERGDSLEAKVEKLGRKRTAKRVWFTTRTDRATTKGIGSGQRYYGSGTEDNTFTTNSNTEREKRLENTTNQKSLCIYSLLGPFDFRFRAIHHSNAIHHWHTVI